MKSTVDTVIEQAYLLPALIEYFSLGEDSPVPVHLERVFELSFGVGKAYIPKLRELKQYQDLLRYHWGFLKEQGKVFGNNNYDTLRKGLSAYFDKNLSHIFTELELVGTSYRFLDYGSGGGQYARKFKELNPNATVTTVDRKDADINIDFESFPSWYEQITKKYDIVLLSEVLHCKDSATRNYLLKSSLELLNDNGQIIVVENVQAGLDWRLRELTDGGRELPEEAVRMLFYLSNTIRRDKYKPEFLLKKIVNLNSTHTAYVYTKIP